MRTCPVCSRQYEPPAQFCQVDGVALRIDAPSVDPYLGTKILEQFRLDRVIGAGGMGVVYEGWNDALSRRVAVKILHRDLVTNKDIVTRFHREAQIASQLDHTGIVRVILFGQLPDGNLYLVLEFLEGPTLAEALQRDGAFGVERAVRTVGQIADAIGYAHGKGIVHRDLKPENIVLTTRDGEEIPKVLDFGIAKMLVGAASFVTQSGLIFGTARYISPEGAAGEKVDPRSDVYSLGVMAYEMMAGRAPFEADEPVQLLVKHMHETPTPLRQWGPAQGVPAGVAEVVMRALAKNPDVRHDDAAMFATALREALAAARAAGPAGGAIVTPAPRPRRPPDALAPTAHPTPVANGSMRAGGNGAMVPAIASALPRREEFPVVDPRTLPLPTPSAAPPVEPAVPVTLGPPPPPTMAMSELVTGQVIPLDDDIQVSGLRSRRVTRPMDDDVALPPRRRSGFGRALGLVFLAAFAASGVMLGGAWALRVFPAQRRADNVAALLRRATDAMRAERFTRATNRYSVEDITDDVIAIEPGNVRARQLRRAAAVKLENSATTARNNHHPEQAVPLLVDALRLMDDATIREELAAARREVEAQQAPPTAAAPRGSSASGVPPVVRRAPATPRRNAPAGRDATAPTTAPPEPGVTFTPGRDANEPPPGPVIQTPFGPLQFSLPSSTPEPAPAPTTSDPPSAPHSGEF